MEPLFRRKCQNSSHKFSYIYFHSPGRIALIYGNQTFFLAWAFNQLILYEDNEESTLISHGWHLICYKINRLKLYSHCCISESPQTTTTTQTAFPSPPRDQRQAVNPVNAHSRTLRQNSRTSTTPPLPRWWGTRVSGRGRQCEYLVTLFVSVPHRE